MSDVPAANPCRPWRGLAFILSRVVVLLSVGLLAGSCSSEPAKAKRVDPVLRDTPSALRGTVGSEVTISGIQPTLVSGYGLVVGLNGTGGQPLNQALQATMERTAGLMDVGKAQDLGDHNPLSGKTPRELLRDPNVAVVLVQAAIPPGSPKNGRFDVTVKAINASSLEGGTLWTTELRFGPPGTFGQAQTRQIATAHGPIFVNPFLEKGKEASDFNLQAGRVLGGGLVTEPLDLELIMDNPSHVRARTITAAINSRFPEGRGDRGPTARGRSGGNYDTGSGGRIAVRVPSAYRTRSEEFLRILQGVQIDPTAPEEYARRYVAALKAEPGLADDLSYCLEGLGPKSMAFLRELYNSAEPLPQMAALRAGVGLGDALATPTLLELARHGTGNTRLQAISLLADAKAGPQTDVVLQELLGERELLVRIGAYEALAKRAERTEFIRRLDLEMSRPDRIADAVGPTVLEEASSLQFAPSIQGIDRTCIGCTMGRTPKFLLDVVPFGEPLVYITQQGLPRVVLFGSDLRIERPLLATAWSNRLMLTTDESSDAVRVSYRPGGAGRAYVGTAPDTLQGLIEFFAHDPSPEDPRPGLGMRFSEVIGALYAIYQESGTKASFATERDRLLAAVLSATKTEGVRQRPETSRDVENIIVLDRPTPKAGPEAKPGSLVQPIEPKKKD